MPSWIVPSDAHVTGDTGHTSDHNHMADDLTIVSGLVPVSATMAAGDLIIQNGTPAPARLAVGSANQVLGVSAGLPAWQASFTLQAQTAAAGYTFVNSTGTIVTWTTPNDGALHHVMIMVYIFATSAMTGGNVTMTFTDPAGNANTNAAFLSGGLGTNASGWNDFQLPVKANTAVTISQNTAMSAGAAKAWAEIWGC